MKTLCHKVCALMIWLQQSPHSTRTPWHSIVQVSCTDEIDLYLRTALMSICPAVQLTAYEAIYANGSTSSNLPPGIQFTVHDTPAPGPGGQVSKACTISSLPDELIARSSPHSALKLQRHL